MQCSQFVFVHMYVCMYACMYIRYTLISMGSLVTHAQHAHGCVGTYECKGYVNGP